MARGMVPGLALAVTDLFKSMLMLVITSMTTETIPRQNISSRRLTPAWESLNFGRLELTTTRIYIYSSATFPLE
jgi:hypothetical protein